MLYQSLLASYDNRVFYRFQGYYIEVAVVQRTHTDLGYWIILRPPNPAETITHIVATLLEVEATLRQYGIDSETVSWQWV
jgi:hypothetical protein